jgi:hypothetical protein
VRNVCRRQPEMIFLGDQADPRLRSKPLPARPKVRVANTRSDSRLLSNFSIHALPDDAPGRLVSPRKRRGQLLFADEPDQSLSPQPNCQQVRLGRRWKRENSGRRPDAPDATIRGLHMASNKTLPRQTRSALPAAIAGVTRSDS